jgi:rare lipoprotein A
MRWGAVVAVGLVSTLAGCSWFSKPKPIEPGPGATQEGVASWYGPGFHGRRTSSGEIYNQYDLTAAHQTLPHGTRVRVTNLTNGRTVLVRINDRGPFVDDRIIDLSYTAAQRIEMIGPGTAPVRIEVVGPGAIEPVEVADLPPPRVAPPPPPRGLPPPPVAVAPVAARVVPTNYAVQIGAFTDYERARRAQRGLESRGTEAHLALVDEGGMRYYRLRVGPFSEAERASQVARRITDLGFPALVVAGGAGQ